MPDDWEQFDQSSLVELVHQLCDENRKLREELEQLKSKNPPTRLNESYSVDAEEKRRRDQDDNDRPKPKGKGSTKAEQNSQRRGRRKAQDKIERSEHIELVIPEGFDIGQCTFAGERPVWRIINGKAVLVAYEIYRGPNGETAAIPGVFGRSEFGFEVSVAVAFIVSVIGVSLDKAADVLKFFWQLDLSKSQIDALLNQLSKRWETEFETLCDLLAASAVVHADETGWSINSAWAFLSERARVFVFGCRKNADTLANILPKTSFTGILHSDNAAVYKGYLKAQKCWAHLLRKAIKLVLLHPEECEYRFFLDELLAVFYDAKRFAADQRFPDNGRAAKVNELDNQLANLLVRYCAEEPVVLLEQFDNDFENLVFELVGLMSDDELFTFVRHMEAAATNNEAERSLRDTALARGSGRGSKTPRGARRRSVLTTVFESLKLHLASFHLATVLAEVGEWQQTGKSLFDRLRIDVGLDPPGQPRLENLVPSA